MQQVVGRISALTNPLTFIIINIATIAVIVSGGKQVYAGILTQGEVVALVNYMSQILVELIKLANLIVQVTKAVACGNRIADVLSIPSKLPEKNPKLIGAKDGAPEVEFDHVCSPLVLVCSWNMEYVFLVIKLATKSDRALLTRCFHTPGRI